MENIFVEFLPPWIETGIQPAFYDKESGTVLQQTARMYARVNMLIRMFNKLSKNTKTTVEDYINQFNELHDYVHDYFDNLDVQEEINNKLDEMAESGVLPEIVGQYLNSTAIWCFDTVADMKVSTNLINGSFARTLGYNSRNDEGGALYKIRKITNDDVVDESTIIEMSDATDELIAELVIEPVMNVKQFGVTTSNTTNTKFQIALTKCEGRKLIIPEGTYRVDSSMTLPDNIEIECHGKITYSGDIIYLFQHPDDTSTGDITFDGIEIEKLDNSFNNLNRFIMVRGGNLRVVNSTFTNYATAIHALFTNSLYCDNNKFYNAYGTLAQYGYGIDTSSSKDTITNCYFKNTNNTNGRHALYINGSTKTYCFVDNIYVEHWQHNPINISIENTNPSKVLITNVVCKDALITSPGSATNNRVGVVQLTETSANVELFVDNLYIEGTLRGAVCCLSTTSRAKISNVYCKFSTDGDSTNWHGMFLRYTDYTIDNIHFEIPDPETTALNQMIIVRSCNCIANNITVNATYGTNKSLIQVYDANLIIGLYANGSMGTVGTSTITPMSMYSA